MADARLRRLEREASGGDLEARGRLLCERVRTGELAAERLRLAAYAGDAAARRALGDAPAGAGPPAAWCWRDPREEELEAWGRGLAPWGKEVSLRAGLVAARLAAPLHAAEAPRDAWPGLVLEAVAAWLACPCAAHAADRRWLEAYERGLQPQPAAGHVLFWTGEALNAERWSWEPLRTGEGAVDAALERALGYAAEVLGAVRVRRAVQAELRGWALER